jgi:hypothetical protein
VQEFFNTAAFAQVPANMPYGNTGRNSLIGPGVINTDFSVFRDFPLANESVLQFRSELFNFFNNVNLQSPQQHANQFPLWSKSAALRMRVSFNSY